MSQATPTTELRPIKGAEGYFMKDPVTVVRKVGDQFHTVRAYPSNRASDFSFYVNIRTDKGRTTRTLRALAAETFPLPIPASGDRITLPEYPSYVFLIDGDFVRVFRGERELRPNQHPRGRQRYFSLVDYTKKRSSVRESSLKIMCNDIR